MSAFLIFTVYAPLASWGDITVGETRGSWDRPSRSAALGIVAAALGIDRSDQNGHDALDQGYSIAVQLDAPGIPLVDYQTAQTVAAAAIKKHRPSTRAEMLNCADPETILSRRSYRQEALATVCLWIERSARWKLEDLATALRNPAYVLYAGRKANVLGLPLSPRVIEANSLAEALGQHVSIPADLKELQSAVLPGGVTGGGAEISHDQSATIVSGLKELRREVRRDASANRSRWQFKERTVMVGRQPLPDEEAIQ